MAAPNFFDAGSPYLSHPLLTSERSAAELDEILGRVPKPRRVLDLGCGFGRHTVELAARGMHVTAVDPSPTMCDATRQRLAALGQEAEVLCGTAADVSGDPFDLVLCLFTTFGQVGPDRRPPAEQMADIATQVAAGGHLVLEVPDRDRAVEALVASEQLGPTTVTRRWDNQAGTLEETFATPDGEFRLAVRLFGTDELAGLVRGAGLDVVSVLDRALVPPPPTLTTVFARRPELRDGA